jgi:hypothetical protein
VKTSHLHEIDVARIGPLSESEKLIALRKVKSFIPPYTLNPFRQNIPDTLNILPNMLGDGSRTPLEVIRRNVRSACKSEKEVNANWKTVEALYAFSEEHGIRGRQYELLSLPVGIGESVRYWSNAIVSVDGIPMILYVDPRKTANLRILGRKFVFSVQNERIKAYQDLNSVALGIIEFTTDKSGYYKPKLTASDRTGLYDYTTLNKMVKELYTIWRQVLDEREEQNRRTGTEKPNPMAF